MNCNRWQNTFQAPAQCRFYFTLVAKLYNASLTEVEEMGARQFKCCLLARLLVRSLDILYSSSHIPIVWNTHANFICGHPLLLLGAFMPLFIQLLSTTLLNSYKVSNLSKNKLIQSLVLNWFSIAFAYNQGKIMYSICLHPLTLRSSLTLL